MTFLIDVGADAAFGDTYSTMPYNYTQGALDRNQPWFVLEPEVGVFHNLSALATQAISTAYWGSEGGPGPPYDYQPPISLAKWLEPRHQVHLSQRWAKHRVDGTQFAWFNGIGYCVWTSVWGVRNPDTDRDVRQQKQMLTMLRYLAPVWNYPTVSLPLYPVNADCGGVYAWLRTYSAVDYPGYDDHTAYLQTSAIVINLVNRRSSPCVDHGSNTTAFDLHLNTTALNIHFVDPVLVDLYEGTQIPAVINSSSFFIKHTVGAGGIGCILVVESAALPTLSAIMATMAQLTAVPLSHYADVWQNPPQHLTPRPAASHPAHPLRLTSLVKPSGPFYFNVTGVWVEGPADFGAGVQFPWETEPVRNHSHWMNVSEFSIDTSLVLQQDYNCLKAHQNATFCSQQPLVSPALPAVNVTWHEAQHHCQQCGGRLPHDWEWQLAAQGLDNRTFPWGIAWNSSKIPPLDRSTAPRPADPVGRYPASQSPYGVQDLLGNVWQLTDQSCDDVTCFNIIRGSSLYYPSVAMRTRWYLPSAHPLWQHNRLLVYGPDLDRSPYVGFRCVYS
jgi:formylglycine-generating enzyme required for sulfatase activity